MKRLAVLALPLAAAACSFSPETFVGEVEPRVVLIPVRQGLTYDELWDRMTTILRTHFTIESESKVAGFARTEYAPLRSVDPRLKSVGASPYRVRAVARIRDDGRSLEVETHALSGKPGREKLGYDWQFLDALADELRSAVGREGGRPGALADAVGPSRQEPPGPPAPEKPPPRFAAPGPSRVGVRFCFGDLRGRGEGDRSAFADTAIGFDSDADLESALVTTADVGLGIAPWFSLRLGYTHGRWSGSSTLDKPESFDGLVFPAGTPLDSEFELDVFSLQPTVHAGEFSRNSPVSVDASLDFRAVRGTLELDGSPGEGSESWGVYFLGFGADVAWHFESGPLLSFSCHPLVLGVPPISFGGEFALGFGFRKAPVDLEIGYRYFTLDAFHGSGKNGNFRLTYHGPSVGVTVIF